jgi:ABC-2 type transport system permease protein
VLVVARRELGAYFDSSIAYAYLIAALVLLTSLFMNEFFLTGRLDMTPLFDALAPLSVFLLPAVTMRLWAEDRKARTFELYVTLPLRAGQLVLGKYLAALALYGLFLLGTAPVVAMLVSLGDPDLGRIAAGYLGAFLHGALLLAVGSLLSALTADQIVAFVTGVAAGFVLVFSGDPRVVAVLDGMAPELGAGSRLAGSLSTLPRYDALLDGLVELSTVTWFVGLAAACLWVEALAVERLRS